MSNGACSSSAGLLSGMGTSSREAKSKKDTCCGSVFDSTLSAHPNDSGCNEGFAGNFCRACQSTGVKVSLSQVLEWRQPGAPSQDMTWEITTRGNKCKTALPPFLSTEGQTQNSKLPSDFPPWRAVSSQPTSSGKLVANTHLVFRSEQDAGMAKSLWPACYGELRMCTYQTTLDQHYFSHGKLVFASGTHKLRLVVEGTKTSNQPTQNLQTGDYARD